VSLNRFEVRGFRNLEAAELEFAPGVNIIHGANAAGKTSLLEAVHFLARARSFATSRAARLVRRASTDGLLVRGEIDVGRGKHRLGIGWREGRLQVRMDGAPVRALSECAWLLPVQVINTEAQRLLTEGPAERRSFVNWGVFHVEHAFRDAWRRYQRALRQRNAALRAGDARLAAAWEPELETAALAVDRGRRDFLEALAVPFRDRMQAWLPGLEIQWRYRRGWPEQTGLRETLELARGREVEQGYTLYGPHRMELRLLADGVDAGWRLSRGQQKLLVTALRLAQVEQLARYGSARPLLLVDDLPAELDVERRGMLLDALFGLDAQILITAIARGDLPPLPEARVFHVEQGRYTLET